jgi:hypothetical protein
LDCLPKSNVVLRMASRAVRFAARGIDHGKDCEIFRNCGETERI